MTFRSKVLARTKKYDGQTDGHTDRRTDGHPKPIGPQPFGLGPNKKENLFFLERLQAVKTYKPQN